VSKPAAPPPRLAVVKTLKMYVGGKFIRSESGHTLTTRSARGETMYVCKASRKDLRDTVEIARAAQPGWAERTAYNRGQILYRLAEMLEDRLDALPTARADAEAAVDRAVHHAGWADKVSALLSSLNPVGGAYVNYSMLRPLGVIAAVPDPADGLLGMVEAACAIAVMGNASILLVDAQHGELAASFCEALATSDLPGGVVNVLTGDVPDALTWIDKHDDVDGLYVAGAGLDAARYAASQVASARSLRRVIHAPSAATAADPLLLQRLAEVKTVWMSS
jgi:acyl-CoA reductase-like NAD-dependent aldehyde dehydrogenase